MPREGYPPEVISGFSWGGRQGRARPEQKLRRFPSGHPSPASCPRASPRSGLRAREGTAGAVCPDRPIRWGHRQGEGRCLTGSPPNPILFAMGFPEQSIPESSAMHVGQPQLGTPRTCPMTGERWAPAARGHHWDALDLRCGQYDEATEGGALRRTSAEAELSPASSQGLCPLWGSSHRNQ